MGTESASQSHNSVMCGCNSHLVSWETAGSELTSPVLLITDHTSLPQTATTYPIITPVPNYSGRCDRGTKV